MQHNEMILLLQYHKLLRHSDETAEKWMGRLRGKASECTYQEGD